MSLDLNMAGTAKEYHLFFPEISNAQRVSVLLVYNVWGLRVLEAIALRRTSHIPFYNEIILVFH